jgi:hypothetical protein
LNGAAEGTVAANDFLSFASLSAAAGLQWDGGTNSLTLGSASFYRFTLQLNVQSAMPGSTLLLMEDGAATSMSLSIDSNGAIAADWILACQPNAQIQFQLASGGLDLLDASLVVMGLGS